MLTVAVLVVSLLAAFFGAAFFITRRDIGEMARALKKINDLPTNAAVRLPSPNRQLEKLAVEINRSLSQKKEARARYKRMDMRQKRDIENISHDLRTPLTSVIGYIELLEDGSLSPEERKKYKKILIFRAKSLESLISGFYDLSRLESGEYRFETESVNLQKLLCEILASFYQDFSDKGIEPQVSIDEKAPPVMADRGAVRRVFTNLIQNALKHDGGNFRVVLRRDGGRILTAFENDAPQLSPESASHLFERFYTADRMRTGRNTGLGLAIVRELVEGMGGTIEAKLEGGRLSIIIRWPEIR